MVLVPNPPLHIVKEFKSMKKYLYYYYNLLFFKYYKENKISIFSLDYSRKIVSSYLATLWLKSATKYILQLHIKSLYSVYLNYDGTFTNGILQTPKTFKRTIFI